jgi:hypothetical protein
MTDVKLNIPFSPQLVEPTMPQDPSLRAIAEDVVARLKYSYAAVAAEEQPSASGDLDQMFRSYFGTCGAITRQRHRERSRVLLAAPQPVRARDFGRYAAVDVHQYRTLGSDKLAAHAGVLPVKGPAIKLALHASPKILLKLPPFVPPVDPDLKAGLAFKKMRLFIRRVRCVEETNEIGSDEVNMGGNATDPFGNTSLVKEFVVSDDFDEGEQVDFGMGKVFHTWDIVTEKDGFPHVYAAVLALGEKDDGGFWKFLKELWAKVKSAVEGAIGAAAGAAIGALIGAEFLGIGAIIGAAVGAFIGWLIQFFGSGNHDDVIKAKPILMVLGAATKSYYDWAKLTSPQGWTKTLKFNGDGGRYEVDIAYRVFTQ